jgi:hypothetical protein
MLGDRVNSSHMEIRWVSIDDAKGRGSGPCWIGDRLQFLHWKRWDGMILCEIMIIDNVTPWRINHPGCTHYYKIKLHSTGMGSFLNTHNDARSVLDMRPTSENYTQIPELFLSCSW